LQCKVSVDKEVLMCLVLRAKNCSAAENFSLVLAVRLLV
jgi:hypothetical protein